MTDKARDTRDSMTSESRMYVYATDMVGECYSHVNPCNKSVLTIIGSGDQMLDAYFFGARQVVAFDINERSALFADLKISATKALSYQEFLSFFGDRFDNASFDYPLYEKCREFLAKEVQRFFDGLYDTMTGGDFLRSEYFRQRSFISRPVAEVVSYLKNEESYGKMKSIVSGVRPELLVSDILDLTNVLNDRKFDIINISNIPNYFVGKSEERISEFLSLLRDLARLLSSDGTILFYSYSPLIYENGVVPLASNEDTNEKIQDLGIFTVRREYFQTIGGDGEDSISILDLEK